jgi:hypothetical protein
VQSRHARAHGPAATASRITSRSPVVDPCRPRLPRPQRSARLPEAEQVARVCAYCGSRPLLSTRSVHCGEAECRRLWHNARCAKWQRDRRAAGLSVHKHRYTCTCTVCGSQFESFHRDATYCSTGPGSCLARTTAALHAERRKSRPQQLCVRLRRSPLFDPHRDQPLQHETAAYKRALRQDPCAYCGAAPSGGIDHIIPTGREGDRSDWRNMTGCCKRCNELKRSLPLLVALIWIPVTREYHELRRLIFATP